MDLMDAIYTRHSIRNYKAESVPKETVNKLLEAATMAPSASNRQPWSFVVIQDPVLLKNCSDKAKTLYLNMTASQPDPLGYKERLSDPDFNLFYNASALVIIYGNSEINTASTDCCLAAQNLMLAAHDLKLGTCWIGFSTALFNSADFKKELGIPEAYKAIAPIIVGYPAAPTDGQTKNPPLVMAWK